MLICKVKKMDNKEKISLLIGEIKQLKSNIEELKTTQYIEKSQKTYSKITKENFILKNLRKTDGFKQLIKSLPDNFKMEDLRVSFSYEVPRVKEYEWVQDGNNFTRVIEDNNISNKEIEEKMEKRYLIKTKDGTGNTIIYPDM